MILTIAERGASSAPGVLGGRGKEEEKEWLVLLLLGRRGKAASSSHLGKTTHLAACFAEKKNPVSFKSKKEKKGTPSRSRSPPPRKRGEGAHL